MELRFYQKTGFACGASVHNVLKLGRENKKRIKKRTSVRDKACRGSRRVGVRGFEPPEALKKTPGTAWTSLSKSTQRESILTILSIL